MSYNDLLDILYRLDYDTFQQYPGVGESDLNLDEEGNEITIPPDEIERMRRELVQKVYKAERDNALFVAEGPEEIDAAIMDL